MSSSNKKNNNFIIEPPSPPHPVWGEQTKGWGSEIQVKTKMKLQTYKYGVKAILLISCSIPGFPISPPPNPPPTRPPPPRRRGGGRRKVNKIEAKGFLIFMKFLLFPPPDLSKRGRGGRGQYKRSTISLLKILGEEGVGGDDRRVRILF